MLYKDYIVILTLYCHNLTSGLFLLIAQIKPFGIITLMSISRLVILLGQ